MVPKQDLVTVLRVFVAWTLFWGFWGTLGLNGLCLWQAQLSWEGAPVNSEGELLGVGGWRRIPELSVLHRKGLCLVRRVF